MLARRTLTRPAAIAALLAAVLLALVGCGGGGRVQRTSAALARACPGAVGPAGAAAVRCPYRRVSFIGRRGEGVMRCPEAIAFAPDGDLYVADQFSHLVQRFAPSGRFLGQWGSYGSGPGQLGAVDGLAVDARGDVYVLDSSHDRIERFTPAGRLLGEWGTPGHAIGQLDFGSGEGPDKPPGGGIAVGGGYVYVADSANNRIVRFDLDGSHAVLWGRPGSAPGQFSSPRGLTVSGSVVYVADEGNHRVQALSLQGRPLYVEGTFGKGPGQFVNPFGVAVHGGRVYVVDDNNNRIAVLTRRLRTVEEWSGAGTRYALSYIRAAAVDRAGHLYVADTGNERIVVFSGSGRGLRAFGTPGITPGQLITPLAVATDAAGSVLVAETYGSRSPVYLFDSALRYRTRWERGGGAIIGSHWFGPSAAAFASDGSVWIADPRNDIVRHLSARGAFLGAVGSAGGAADDPVAYGGPSAVGGTGAGPRGVSSGPGALAAADLLTPEGVAVAPSGDLYVADTGHGRIARFAGDGRPLGTLGSGVLREPLAVAIAPGGDLYVADAGDDHIVELSPTGARLGFWGGVGNAPGRFEEPAGIAVDAAGHVFVADRGNGRVQKFAAGGRLLAAWGMTGVAPGELSRPTGIATDCRGAVLVADTQSNRVQIFAGAATRSACATPAGVQ
ncbi:MAG TPA: NHL repeat-containing protein [Solirubrobacteraceae bacterium]|jgi:DNA-binding beta-propeller fold protein YncE